MNTLLPLVVPDGQAVGMTTNGDPVFGGATSLADYLLRQELMRNFPVIRDLVVDISDFMAKRSV